MKTQLLLASVLMLLLAACGYHKPKPVQPAIARDTLAYTYKTVLQQGTDCKNAADTECTYAKIIYPVFTAKTALSDTIDKRMLTLKIQGEKVAPNVNALAKSFVAKGKPKPAKPSVLDITTAVIRQDSSLITLQINGFSYTGGPHGGSLTYFINWNTKTGKSITLNDILTTGYKDQLNAAAEKVFRKEESLTDTSSLKQNYFFKSGKFALNDNYAITPLGIRFFYNENEIKPFAAGTTDVFVPYGQIKSLLKPGTVISQYLKP